MDRLLEALTANGTLDTAAANWARQHRIEYGGSLDSALLELDLIDEDTLLCALKDRFRTETASPFELARIDPSVGDRLPQGVSKSFFMCPLRLAGTELVALVHRPLPESFIQELHDLFGLAVQPLLAPAHYLAVATEKVYGTPLDERSRLVEARLARRRSAPELRSVVSSIVGAINLPAAVDELMQFAARLVEFPCLLFRQASGLRVATSGRQKAGSIPLPELGSTLAPAILHEGYFIGTPIGNDADKKFYRSLERSLPRCVFIAPVPMGRAGSAILYADNGPRGIAARWIAELTVLAGALGQRRGDFSPKPRTADQKPAEQAAPAEIGQQALADPAPSITADEKLALLRLRNAAAEAGTDIVTFVEQLLSRPAASPSPEQAASALAGEVKGLFERLAIDIPTHLARGMEAAFRDLAPRLGPNPPPRATPAVTVDLVQKTAAPREVATYASRRQKTGRVKL